MKAGMGYSAHGEAVEAGRSAAEAAVSASGQPVLTFLFTTDAYDQSAVFEAVKGVVGSSRMAGFCCAGIIVPDEVLSQGVGVCTIAGSELSVATTLQTGLSEDPRGVGHRAAENLLASGIRDGVVFVFPDGFGANISETIRGLYEIMGPDFRYAGGGAGDNLRFFRTFQFTENGVQSDALAAAVLTGIPMNTAIGHGWQPKGEPLVIGETDGKKVIEIDGKTAFDACCDRLGQLTPEQFPENGMKHPFGFPDISGNYLIRDPLAVNPDKSISFVTEVPQNAVGYLMEGKTEDLIATAGKVAGKAVESVAQPEFALCFDCISRFLLMGSEFGKELAAVRDAIGPGVPLLGALTFGEVGSYVDIPHFHNKTMTIVVGGCVGEDEDGTH